MDKFTKFHTFFGIFDVLLGSEMLDRSVCCTLLAANLSGTHTDRFQGHWGHKGVVPLWKSPNVTPSEMTKITQEKLASAALWDKTMDSPHSRWSTQLGTCLTWVRVALYRGMT